MSIKGYFHTIIIFLIFFMWNCKKFPPTPPPINGQNIGTIKGKVLNSIDNRPVQNAIIFSTKKKIADTTNTNGEFRLDSLSFGIDTLIISAAYYDTSHLFIEITKEEEKISIYLDKIPHYYIYAGNRGHNQVFVFDSYTATLINTFFTPNEYYIDGRDCVSISSNGDILIVNARPYNYTEEIKSFYFDIKTGFIIKTFTGIVTRVMPDGYLFLNNGLGNIQILNPDTYDVIMSDTLSIIGPTVFDTELNLLYSQNTDYAFICYNYETKEIIRKYDNLKHVCSIVLSPDCKTLYGTAYQYRFIAYDLESGEYLKILGANHLGNVAIKPDGSEVLLTDPGTMLGPDPGSGKVYFFNTTTLSYDNYIELISENGYPLPTDAIVTGSQGKYAFTSSAFTVYFLNLRTYSLQKTIKLEPGGIQLNYLKLSPNLNY